MPVKRIAIATALGLVGLAVNYLPVEIFPGVHLVFGNVLSILAAVKFGPAAGAIAGLITGLPVGRLWNDPFPLSALLFMLEGLWVGHQTSKRRRGPLVAVLLFWLFIGIWLHLFAQLLVTGAPFHLILIILARSLINALLSGIIAEISRLVWEVITRFRAKAEERPAQLKLRSSITVQLTAMIAVPLLYISTHNVNDLRERTLSGLASASAREIEPLESEIHSQLQNYEHSVERAAAIFHSSDLSNPDIASLSVYLARLRRQRSDFRQICLGDAQGRALVCDPPASLSETAYDDIS